MMQQDDPTNSEPHSEEINERSAHKVLELLLYNLTQNVSGSINSLITSSNELDSDMRLQVTNLKEALNRMELLLKAALKSKSNIGEGDLSAADPDVIERIQVEKVLRTLATTTSTQDSEQFFKYCVKTLAQLYGCQYAFIGLITDSKKSVKTQAVWAGEGYADNFEYELEGTPCAEIINMEKELIPTNASQLYAGDELLVNMNIDSYFGAPILTKEHGVIGLVSVMDVNPMELNEWTAPVLGVFASRLAIELQRKRAVDELQQLNNTLEERITERTRDLEASNRELAAFSYSVSHDLRAPVRTINSFMNILFEDFGEQFPSEAVDYLQRIQRAGNKLDHLIEDLLELSRVTRTEMLRKRVNISKLVTEEVQVLREMNPERQIEIRIADHMESWGDEGLLKILFQNLLSNAWKYTAHSENPIIEIGRVNSKEKNNYYVKDNGIGFDMKYSDQLFQPFQRLHTDEEFEGNGVGLATIMRIINRHGGEIRPESEVGKGTTFYFTLGESKPIRRQTS